MGTSETVCPQEAKGSDDDRQIAFSVITITCKTAEASLSGSGFSSEQAPAKLARSAGVRSYAGERSSEVRRSIIPVQAILRIVLRAAEAVSGTGDLGFSALHEHLLRLGRGHGHLRDCVSAGSQRF
jgi:hypothetical protein